MSTDGGGRNLTWSLSRLACIIDNTVAFPRSTFLSLVLGNIHRGVYMRDFQRWPVIWNTDMLIWTVTRYYAQQKGAITIKIEPLIALSAEVPIRFNTYEHHRIMISYSLYKIGLLGVYIELLAMWRQESVDIHTAPVSTTTSHILK